MTQPDPPRSPASPQPTPRTQRQTSADYRWTMPKVLAFLDALAQSGRVADAARAVGMSRQSAYRMRARLAGVRFGATSFAAAFEGARRQGTRARAAASMGRARSRWEGPGLAEMVALLAARQGDAPAVQGDTGTAQGDAAAAQDDAPHVQGVAAHAQGDAPGRKVTKDRLDSVTSVTGLPRLRPDKPV